MMQAFSDFANAFSGVQSTKTEGSFLERLGPTQPQGL